MTMTRRQILARTSSLGAFALLGGTDRITPTRGAFATQPDVFGYGDLVADPAGMLDLPRGFSYRLLSRTGGPMTDGTRVPAGHDGMAAFPGRDGEVVLVRNHELSPDSAGGVTGVTPYDPRCKGGTTNVVVGDDGAVLAEYASLAGTFRNCAGGATPWNTWLTCEENESHPLTSVAVSRPHGYVFEVDPYAPPAAPPVPLTAMGRFAHEAVAVDPTTGTVYETEDASGPAGCFYRLRPWQPLGGPGSLAVGGVLEVMRVVDAPADLSLVSVVGTTFADVHWDAIPVPDYDPAHPDAVGRTRVRQQTANPTRVPKGEGTYWGDGGVYFVSSFAKPRHEGQVWRYEPASNTLTLVLHIAPGGTFDGPDNAILSPYGGMFLCEDGDGTNYVVGADEAGDLYPFARNVADDGEFAGATFSPNGRTMYVNVQSIGTYAITGPWSSRSRVRRA